MKQYYVKDCPPDIEIINYIDNSGGFKSNDPVGNFTFLNWTLQELNLPSSNTLLESVKKIEKDTGLEGWRTRNMEVEYYRGFSLTYNKDYNDDARSVFHQTWGDYRTESPYSKQESHKLGSSLKGKNTYYDTYGFRHMHNVVKENLGYLFERINGAILRSRVGYLYSENNIFHPRSMWHIDENQHHMLRLVIPVKTSENFVLEIDGEDAYGNAYKTQTHLPCGKAYVWNNRIPHRVVPLDKIPEQDPRIHIIVGFSPWFNYDAKSDSFYENENHGVSVSEILRNKLFIK